MNREYIYLSDKEVIVSDETGHIEKRNINTSNIHDTMLLENALEELKKRIDELEEGKESTDREKFTFFEKAFAYTVPLLASIFVCSIASFMTGTYFLDSYNIQILSWGCAGTIMLDAGMIMFNIEDKKRQKNAKYFLLRNAYTQKRKIEEKIKEDKKQINNENVEIPTNNYLFEPDKIISLDNNPIYHEIEKELNEAYQEGYNQKTKQRILRK